MTDTITGDRELTGTEVEIINAAKDLERQVAKLIRETCDRMNSAGLPYDGRRMALASTNLETGFMWLTKAIAQPKGGLGA